jgi:PAS domain-containing protein
MRVFENRLLTKMFGRKRDDVIGQWRIMLNEELHRLFSSQNIIRLTEARRMGWAGHVARIVDRKGNLWDRDHFEDPRVDGRGVVNWCDLAEDKAGCCESGHEIAGLIKIWVI